MARASSVQSDGTSSSLSNIVVTSKVPPLVDSSEAGQLASSTPPTSVNSTPSITADEFKQPPLQDAAPASKQSDNKARGGSRRASVKQGTNTVKRTAGSDGDSTTKITKKQTKRSSTVYEEEISANNDTSSAKVKSGLNATLDSWLQKARKLLDPEVEVQTPQERLQMKRKRGLEDDQEPEQEEDAEDDIYNNENIAMEKDTATAWVQKTRELMVEPTKKRKLNHEEGKEAEVHAPDDVDMSASPRTAKKSPVRRQRRTNKVASLRRRQSVPLSKLRSADSKEAVSTPPTTPKKRRRHTDAPRNALERSLYIDMVDKPDVQVVEPRDPSKKQTKRGWRGWALVDASGREITPELDSDQEPSPKKQKLANGSVGGKLVDAARRSARAVAEKTASSVGQVATAIASLVGEPSNPAEPEIPMSKRKYNKTMETKGKFYSGQPEKETFPLPHHFFMLKSGPFQEANDSPFHPRDITKTFKLNAEVFNPRNEVFARDIKDWHVTRGNKNTFVGNAKQSWSKSPYADLPLSFCICNAEDGCDESCLNRVMGYECNETNCLISADACGNRPFYDLSKRLEKAEQVNNRQRAMEKARAEKANQRANFNAVLMSFEQGVEVFKTAGKGFGVRAQRSFQPGQIIMEYFGEIIDADEVQDRMATVYKDSSVRTIIVTSCVQTNMPSGLLHDGVSQWLHPRRNQGQHGSFRQP